MDRLMLVDTPNISKSVATIYGNNARPDFKQLYQSAAHAGSVLKACALVNDGVSFYFKEKLTRIGFSVQMSHAHDCDDALFAWAIKLYHRENTVILCSGDHGFLPLVQMFKRLRAGVIVCAVRQTCSRRLREAADIYQELPIKILAKSLLSLPGQP